MIHKLLLYSLVLLAAPLCGQGIYPVLTADTQQVRLGEPVGLTLSVTQREAGKIRTIIWPTLTDTLNENVVVLQKSPPDTSTADSSGYARFSMKIQVTAYDSGQYRVSPLPLVINGDTTFSNAVGFFVNTVPVDTTAAIHDIKDIVEVPYSLWDWLKENKYWVLGGLVAILLLTYLLRRFLKREKNTPEVQVAKDPVISHYEQCLSKLMELKNRKAWNSLEPKVFFSEVTDTVREYIEREWEIPAREQTSAELMASLKYISWNQREKNSLGSLLSLGDMAKFAKARPDESDAIKALDDAITFIQNTHAVLVDKKKEEKTSD